jgi:hypothetical protein
MRAQTVHGLGLCLPFVDHPCERGICHVRPRHTGGELWKTPVAHSSHGGSLQANQGKGRKDAANLLASFYIAIGVYLAALMLVLGWWARFPR